MFMISPYPSWFLLPCVQMDMSQDWEAFLRVLTEQNEVPADAEMSNKNERYLIGLESRI